MNDLFLFSFILIPIINSPNHTGKKRSLILYFVSALVFLLLNGEFLNWNYYLPFFIFLLLGISEYQRQKLRQFHDSITDSIDEFFEKKLVKDKPHKIYEEIIARINESGFRHFFKIKRIMCFRLFENSSELVVVNTSEFLWEYDCYEKDKIFTNYSKGNHFLSDIKFEIDGKNLEQNMLVLVSAEDDTKSPYIFLFDIESKSLRALDFLYDGFFITIMKKVSRKLQLEREIWLEKRSQIQQVSKKREFVSNAENSVHFIKNKLGSIVNYIQGKENIKSGNYSPEKVGKLVIVNEEDFDRMKIGVDSIKRKTLQILDKSKNPFRFNNVQSHSISKLFSLLHKELQETNVSNRISYNFSELRKENSTNKIISFDEEGFESTFALVVSNLDEHSINQVIINISEDSNNYRLKIINSYNPSKAKELEKICEDYNSEDYMRLLKRKSYGLEQIKDYLNQMSVSSSMTINKEENQITFSIIVEKNQ
ncbi:MAG: hypothetical protein N4A35_10100 [Flavobacteriales bacterium]|jgi:hypothetical protein|nr:hypothetical protein [Flavobacteriales bacterium]